MRAMSVLLPTLGKPTRATSASSLSSRSNQSSSPGSPCSAKAGARRRLLRKRALPLPPRPPSAARQRSPAWARSASRIPSRSLTWVPSGTGTSMSAPAAPCFFLPWPWTPFSARRWGWSRKASSEDTLRVATSQTSPPVPPSPPSGPPRDTWASRRNDTHPAPPSPARAQSCASSTNPATPGGYEQARRPPGLVPAGQTPVGRSASDQPRRSTANRRAKRSVMPLT